MHASRVTRTVLAARTPRPRNFSSFLLYESRSALLPNQARRCPGCCTRLVFKDRLARMYATVVDEGSRSEPGRQKRGLDEAASGAGVGKQAYPYPTHPNPTPHQIFHLPYGASQTQIKARYYDLVRSHHPDSFHSKTLPPSVAHARFRQIKASYDFLRGHTLSPHPNARQAPQPREFDPYLHELARRRRAREASSGQTRPNRPNADTDEAFAGSGSSNHGFTSAWTRGGFDGFGAHRDDRSNWNPSGRNERIILGCGVFTLLVGLFPDLPFVVYDAFVPPVGIVDGSVSRRVGEAEENQRSKRVGDETKVESRAQGSLPSSSSLVPISPPSSESNPNLPPIANTDTNTYAISNPDGPVFSENEVSTTTGYGFFTAGPDKAHRSAVAALKQARYERTEMGLGVEMREGVKKRVAEIKAQKEQQQQQQQEGDSSEIRAEAESSASS